MRLFSICEKIGAVFEIYDFSLILRDNVVVYLKKFVSIHELVLAFISI